MLGEARREINQKGKSGKVAATIKRALGESVVRGSDEWGRTTNMEAKGAGAAEKTEGKGEGTIKSEVEKTKGSTGGKYTGCNGRSQSVPSERVGLPIRTPKETGAILVGEKIPQDIRKGKGGGRVQGKGFPIEAGFKFPLRRLGRKEQSKGGKKNCPVESYPSAQKKQEEKKDLQVDCIQKLYRANCEEKFKKTQG